MLGISRKELIWLTDSLATMLDAGLPMSRALEVMAGQAKGGLAQRVARVKAAVDAGANLTEALQAERAFPPLFLQLVAVGEESGTLDRTLRELARYYEFQQQLWRGFIARVLLPVLEYVAAVAVISGATYLVAVLQDQPASFMRGLAIGYGIPAAIILSYVVLVKPLGATRLVHEVLLHVPVVGQVARTIALARFSLVMQLMLETAIPVTTAVVRASEATGNGAFAARGPKAARLVEEGGTLTEAIEGTGLFPREYIEVVRIAEESGKLSERFAWLAEHHADRAQYAMRALAAAMAWAIWVAVAAVIISFIFRFFTSYVGELNKVMG